MKKNDQVNLFKKVPTGAVTLQTLNPPAIAMRIGFDKRHAAEARGAELQRLGTDPASIGFDKGRSLDLSRDSPYPEPTDEQIASF